jgi:hypothetical protein
MASSPGIQLQPISKFAYFLIAVLEANEISADNAETTDLDSLSIACSSCHCNSSSDDYVGYHLPCSIWRFEHKHLQDNHEPVHFPGWLAYACGKNAED